MNIRFSRILFFLFILLLLTPLVLWIMWVVTPKHPLKVLIIDKTVLTTKANEHKAFNWYLKNRKYVKPDRQYYVTDKDYLGFFPKKDYHYEIHDLHTYSDSALDRLSDSLDMVYLTDTYGIYENEWYRDTLLLEHSRKIYGGLDKQDVALLQRMKKQNKLILTEFNFFASPTPSFVRHQAEKLLGIKWSGWTLRYFEVLDTLKNNEIPNWVTRLYKKQHHGQWPFKKSGIVFVNESERIEILDEYTDLKILQPTIYAETKGKEHYNLPKKIHYPYWIDITFNQSDSNEILSYYEISTTLRGDSILRHAKIPSRFPSVIAAKNQRFFYFAGDYADNNIEGISVYFKYADWFKRYINKEKGETNRDAFYWRFYTPMMDVIMHDYMTDTEK
jgi:hypothetical protein